MPSLIDFLLQPWKILTVLFVGSGTQPTLAPPVAGMDASAGAARAAWTGGLCQVRDLGGGDSMLACRIFGYEMPAFVFFASIVIAGIFAWALFSLSRETRVLAKALHDFDQALRKIASSPEKISTTELTDLGALMLKNPQLKPAWFELRDHIRASSAPSGDAIESSAPISQILSRDVVIAPHLNTSVYQLIPGVLTGLGLLMTFVAILDGLSHVSVSASMDVRGIAGLINGLSGKFFSSVVAVLSAVSFTLGERWLLRPLEQAHQRAVLFLQARVRARM